MKKKNTVTVTRISYQLVEVFSEIEVSLDELEGLIDLSEDDGISDTLDEMLNDSGNIIYYASDDANDFDWDGTLEPFKIPYNEHSSLMGSVLMVDDSCVSYYMDERITIGDKKTDIHDFSKVKHDTLSNYIKSKRRTDTINDIIK